MQPVVRSVNVGGPRGGILPKGRDTAIDKRPVDAIEVRDPGPKRGGLGSGVVGDVVVRTMTIRAIANAVTGGAG